MLNGDNDPQIIDVSDTFCPNCGWEAEDMTTLVRRTLPQHYRFNNQWGLSWKEIHKCPNCKTYFRFENSNL